jgi:hypothetical protein
LHLEEAAAKDCDLLLLHGWFEAGSWVRRELPVMAQVTAATPEYWKRQRLFLATRATSPDHNCLSYRNPYGKLLDLWRYRQTGPQGDVVEEVVVQGLAELQPPRQPAGTGPGPRRRDAYRPPPRKPIWPAAAWCPRCSTGR